MKTRRLKRRYLAYKADSQQKGKMTRGWDKVAHLISLVLSEQDSAACSSPTFEDNVKTSTELASKFCPPHVHKLSAELVGHNL